MFYSVLEQFDDEFKNHCLDNVGCFLFLTNVLTWNIQIPIKFLQNYNILNMRFFFDLITHATDESLIFNYTVSICNCLKENKGNKLSREHISILLKKLEDIIKLKFPIVGGLTHDGYKLSCMATIMGSRICAPSNNDWDKVKLEIENINNLADQSFLYTHISHYIKENRQETRVLKFRFSKSR